MDDEDLERKLANIFFIESGEMLTEASVALLKAEETGNPQEAIHRVFRAIHSIKGGAQSLGFEKLAEVAHRMEDFLVPLRQGDSNIDEQAVSLMLASMDVIETQLGAYQVGEVPVDGAELLMMLAKITAQAEGTASGKSAENSQEIAVMTHGDRLLYLSFNVDQSAPMPGVTAFILLEQLRKSGRLLYSRPDVENFSMAVAGEYFKQIAIVQTDMCNDAVKQEADRVSNIYNIKVAEIDNGIFSNADKPTKREIAYFNFLVGKLEEILCSKNREKAYAEDIAGKIADWGGGSRGAVGWFPGGLLAWQRMTSLLVDTVVLTNGPVFNDEMKLIEVQALQILWETVYHSLYNHTYFYHAAMNAILAGNGLVVVEQFEASAVDIQVVIIDVSKLMILEGGHLRMLADFRDAVARNGWGLWLISEGAYTRRHLNVLEVSEEFVGALPFYPSCYRAVIGSQKKVAIGGDGHVSEI